MCVSEGVDNAPRAESSKHDGTTLLGLPSLQKCVCENFGEI